MKAIENLNIPLFTRNFKQNANGRKGPVKLIKRVKIAHSFLQTVSDQFHVIILRTTVPFVTAHLEIFHCTHHPVISKSDLYFTFCSTLNALSKRTSK